MSNKNLWVIPCHVPSNDQKENLITYKCLDCILEFHPQDTISVCDSGSLNKQEIKNLELYYQFDQNVKFYGMDTCFVWGALLRTIQNINYHRYEKICLIHDSMILNSNIQEFLDNSEVSCVSWFHSFLGAGPGFGGYGFADVPQKDWAVSVFENLLNIKFIDFQFIGTLGSTIFFTPEILDKCLALGMDKISVTSKSDDQAMERILGYVLDKCLGYKFYENSIFGNFFASNHNNNLMTKHFYRRT